MARQPEPPTIDSSAGRSDSVPSLDAAEVDDYLSRIGIDLDSVDEPDHATLARIQRAHVTTVPFENLDIVGDPHDADSTGPGIRLSISSLPEKIVERERGGYCFELNGLFHHLLGALAYDVDRVAARVDGGLTVPTNHHANVVTLDQRYVVDVGTGAPMIRQPIPFDGTVVVDEIGVRWRLTECPRPDEEYQTEYREPGDDEWRTRYVFSHIPRDLGYFEATNDYLQSAPESSFTGGPTVQIATADGHLKLDEGSLWDTADASEQDVPPGDWHDVLEAEFGIHLDDT